MKPGDIYESFTAKHQPPEEGSLRVWWIPQVPGEQFVWPVGNLKEAALLLDALAAYDDFQLAHRVKGDYCNAGGLLVYHEGDWGDWHDENGFTLDELRRNFYCHDCGSNRWGHHTVPCTFADPGEMRDLPHTPGTQWWTEAKPR